MARAAAFFDLDDTMLCTAKVEADLATAARQQRIPPDIWQSTYEETRAAGYTPENHVKLLWNREVLRTAGEAEALLKNMRHRFLDMRTYVYDDVKLAVERAGERRIQLFCVTYGSQTWQATKLQATGLASRFTLLVTDKPLAKAATITRVVRDMQFDTVGFVDNFVPELDLVADVRGIKTFWMKRSDSACAAPAGYIARHPHRLVSDLLEVVGLLR